MVARGQVLQFSGQPSDPHLASVRDELQRTLGRIVAFADIAMYLTYAGGVFVSAGAPGTALFATATAVDFGDAGIDFMRVISYATGDASNPSVGIFDVTTGKTICSVVCPAGTNLNIGTWTQFTPHGGDETIYGAVTGGGANVTLFTVHLQVATLNAKP